MRIYGIPQIEDKSLAFASALTYWVFRCRSKKSPAMGIKTWEYLQSSVKNSAIPSRTINDYLEQLCNKLVVPTLKPKEWAFVIEPDIKIMRLTTEGTLLEVDIDQQNEGLKFQGWQSILSDLAIEGITEKHILQQCLKYPHLVTTYARVRYEEDKAIGQQENFDDIEVESNEIE